ncbi:unnamed protein product [Ixodes hexagonus]
MSATVLFEVKKKRRAPSTKKSPFPLVFNLGCDDKSSIVTWQFYRGTLRPDGVEVTAREDMKNLYHMGYFGKGSLSRSAPRFKAAAADLEDAPEMSHWRYERHKKMQEQASSDMAETQSNAKLPRFVLLKRTEGDEKGDDKAADGENLQRMSDLNQQDEEHKASFAEQPESGDQEVMRVFECTVSVGKGEASTSGMTLKRHRESNSDEDIIEVFSKTNVADSQQDPAETNSQRDTVLHGNGVDSIADDEVMQDAADLVPRTHPSASEVELGAASDDDVTEVPSERALDLGEAANSDTGILQIDLDGNDEETRGNNVEGSSRRRKDGSSRNCKNLLRICEANDVEVITSDNGPKLEQERDMLAAEDPWPMDESLQLFFEEAYFLSYGLGCLIVQENNEELDLLKLWQRLCALCPSFPARYATYHHFRSKGWVVRTGAKYAADYLLYKDGPPYYHATFSVLVRQAWCETLEEIEDRRLRSWASLAGLVRLNTSSAKAVLLSYVIIPKDADLSTPECLRSFKIQELLLRRWITSEERERKDDG